ncbi:nicotinate phosphoribosyltransferase [Paucibacter oligotrophus]|uniref:Nicotinate phosphoribosyltransferase n=1 Tax=Roseateles oligotrophus TaxID=1769250 RepID=A0ABT2YF64_9BURK|nr:nicotinate phosphoribosyltransferase [Roseateles oligotrophus]MCV2368693.1 nicotinate phosphoribosyltransferase [Roseateles oligotrophus]
MNTGTVPGRGAAFGALLTDFYQLTMLEAYLAQGMHEPAVFELFVRRLPPGRNFLLAAGLEQALDYLEALSFSQAEIDWLDRQGCFSKQLLDHLQTLRFSGDVHALEEGTPFFASEPLLRLTAPLPQAQLVESRLLNILHYQTLVASKAARVVLAAPHSTLVDFGMRRAHGEQAALFAARASFLAGFSGTATVEAGRRFGIPLFGTMAHSFIQAHDSEAAAFESFLRVRGQERERRQGATTLLLDTYDSEAAAAKAIELARRLAPQGLQLTGVRLDSGDLAAQARLIRRMFDQAGLPQLTIFASGDLDEQRIADLLAAGAPIDGFGIGTALSTSSDVPSLDAVYKLQSYAGQPRRKRSQGKATWPGIKQLYRRSSEQGMMSGDLVALESEGAGEINGGRALLQAVMQGGRRLAPAPSLADLRSRQAAARQSLPPELCSLQAAATPYPVVISAGLRSLAEALDRAKV